MGKRIGNQSDRQLSLSTRTRYRQSLPHDETAASLLTFYPILLGGRDRRARLRTLHRRNQRNRCRQPSSHHPGDDSPGPSLVRPRGQGAQHDWTRQAHRGRERRSTTTTVVEGCHVRARVRSCLAGMTFVRYIIESLAQGGADRGCGRLGLQDIPPKDAIINVAVVG